MRRARLSYRAHAACQVRVDWKLMIIKKCFKGCANCVWLDYAEEVVRYYDSRGMTSNFEELLDTVDKNVEDPMVKAFVKMELKSKYLFNKK